MHTGDVSDSRAGKREVRGRWRPGFRQLNSEPGRITIASTFCAALRFGQSAASVAIAVGTANKTGAGGAGQRHRPTTGHLTWLPPLRAGQLTSQP